MMNPISNGAMPPPPPPPTTSETLTEEEAASLNEILSEYDAENLSETEAQEIVSAISELGIEPGAGLASALDEAGFSAREIGDKAGVGPQDGAPPPNQNGGPGGTQSGMSGEINTEALTALELLLEDYDTDSMTQNDWTEIRSAMEDNGFDMSQPLVDIKV